MSLMSISSIGNINCANALLMESNERYNKISFRQVSHLQVIDDTQFNFIFVSIISGAMEKDAEIKIIMEIGNEQVEKIASCKLEEGVSNEFVQGNFKCTVELDPSEGKLEPSTISLSPENTEINGISDLDKIGLNPSLTDNAIAEIKKRVENGGKVNDLTYVHDYYEEKISPTPIMDSINEDSCEEKGIFKIEGGDVTEDLKIDLPFSYPTSSIKCDINKVNTNQEIETNCTI